jgi:hypothetical protein
MKQFTIIDDNDENDSFYVEAETADEAAHKALEELGWWVSKFPVAKTLEDE